jgi:protein-L-isoaspartate(D-aspartate) O-methyltransferase
MAKKTVIRKKAAVKKATAVKKKPAGAKEPALIQLLKNERLPKAVIDAFRAVDPERFFEPAFLPKLYAGEPVMVGYGQMSDEPLALARMLGLLAPKKKWRVLEVGTGSGFSTAVLSHLVHDVVTIDHVEELAYAAKGRIRVEKRYNVRVFSGDGTFYNKDLGVFDAAIVLAACQKRPLSLLQSLKEGGVLLFPMGPILQQRITVVVNGPGGSLAGDGELFNTAFHEFCRFTPVEGRYGWSSTPSLGDDPDQD